MDKEIINTFIIAARNQNFSKTAEELYLSQSTVSRRIEKLERELDTILFLRSKDGIQLTETAQKLYPYFKEIQAQFEHIDEVLEQQRNFESNTVRITGSYGIQDYYQIGVTFNRLLEKYPNCRYHVDKCEPNRVIEKLTKKETDFALCMALELEDLEAINFHILDNSYPIIVLREDDPLAGKPFLSIDDIKDRNFVLNTVDGGKHFLSAVKTFLQENNVAASCWIDSYNVEDLCSKVLFQEGIAIYSSAMQCTLVGPLTSVPLKGFHYDLRYIMAYWPGTMSELHRFTMNSIRQLSQEYPLTRKPFT